ncbi:MAG TPA: L-seryl-tRNA(Sec) selenium transferase, partial [Dongiaceae bacterium]|nr:L-seryl-tRNA(Sec) selenium transferase [Dongiaceae bacterium]
MAARKARPRRPAGDPALRALPPIDTLLGSAAIRGAIDRHGRRLVTGLLRAAVDDLRARARRERLPAGAVARAAEGLPEQVVWESGRRALSSLVPLVNATGVVVHTNLGRAPLPAAAIERIQAVAGHYTTLEYDLARGDRGSRSSHLERLLGVHFPGCAGLAVNNNAAALLLALNTLAEGREVLVSRGELVEIGGSFRVPEIMAKSGAILREVGTTNRTRLADYERAISKRTALVLRVHPSNYRIVGFTASVEPAALAALARRRRVPFLVDQGSGNLVDLGPYGVRDEPTVQETLKAGADLACFSGDKLLGGPQAGILVGRPALVARLKANPLARALRADKILIAALEAVLLAHLRDDAAAILPVLRMITARRDTLEARARALADRLRSRLAGRLVVELTAGESVTGGGAA